MLRKHSKSIFRYVTFYPIALTLKLNLKSFLESNKISNKKLTEEVYFYSPAHFYSYNLKKSNFKAKIETILKKS